MRAQEERKKKEKKKKERSRLDQPLAGQKTNAFLGLSPRQSMLYASDPIVSLKTSTGKARPSQEQVGGMSLSSKDWQCTV